MSEYNVELINERLQEFKNRRSNSSDPITVLFDADDTLYRFSTYGMISEATRSMYTKYFFKNLPIFEEAPIVIDNLQRLGIRCGICSSLIESPYCEFEKRQSFAYYFPMINPEDIHLVPFGTKKPEIFDDVSNIVLVDNYYKSINDWYEAGGIAIKKSYSGKMRPVPVVTSLIDLFSVLHDLGVY